MKRCFLLILSILLVLGFSIHQKPQWKGTITEENGVKVIKNAREPLYGELTFELEKDLSIGNEEEENFLFNNFVMPGLDSEGNIYVMDSGKFRIQKFDKEGNFKKSFKPPHSFSCLGVTTDGNVVIEKYRYPPEDEKIELLMLNSEGNLIKNVASFPYQKPYMIKGHSPQNPYSYGLYFCSSSYGIEAYGYSSEYRIFFLNTSGELVRVVTKDEMPASITKKEKKQSLDRFMEMQENLHIGPKLKRSEVIKAYKFPEFKPFFSNLIMDDKGRLYIQRFKSEDYDVYNPEGYYLYNAKISPKPRIINNGYFYNVRRDPETDCLKPKRYRIKNWDQIK
jgi:hypothetical protein